MYITCVARQPPHTHGAAGRGWRAPQPWVLGSKAQCRHATSEGEMPQSSSARAVVVHTQITSTSTEIHRHHSNPRTQRTQRWHATLAREKPRRADTSAGGGRRSEVKQKQVVCITDVSAETRIDWCHHRVGRRVTAGGLGGGRQPQLNGLNDQKVFMSSPSGSTRDSLLLLASCCCLRRAHRIA